jgi:hypothetical protein
VYLFQATLPFGQTWLIHLMRESATITFFVVVGYWFSPEAENPLLKAYDSDEEVRKKNMKTKREEQRFVF